MPIPPQCTPHARGWLSCVRYPTSTFREEWGIYIYIYTERLMARTHSDSVACANRCGDCGWPSYKERENKVVKNLAISSTLTYLRQVRSLAGFVFSCRFCFVVRRQETCYWSFSFALRGVCVRGCVCVCVCVCVRACVRACVCVLGGRVLISPCCEQT